MWSLNYFIRLMRMETADFYSCFIRRIAADHFDSHITPGYVKDIDSAANYALLIRSHPGLNIDKIFFEDLHLREEENARPKEEGGDISDDLLLSYIRSSDIDIVKFMGKYNGKCIEIGIRKHEWEVWLRIWHLTGRSILPKFG